MSKDWSDADALSDRIVDLANQRLAEGVSPLHVLAGQLLALKSLISTMPPTRPVTGAALMVARLSEWVDRCLASLKAMS